MDKVTARQQFLAKRKTLSANDVKRRSELIARRFFDFLKKHGLADKSPTIHTFLPIKRQNEVDTWLIIRHIWSEYTNLRIIVPVTDISTNALRHYNLHPQTALVENRWGISEPVTDSQASVSPADFDIVLVPLLAFDEQGNRVGYGGGFYDRFLADCRPDCRKIGLSLFDPIKQIEDTEQTDVPLDICITPDRVWLFSQ
ncbi:5-formyltetrahydrofolate cyclo-ligase [Spirosoma validum]|uniref:5-formyltetrahydrofolate cyclo-ligase n=1 Tax=Spirosoma validum TaxID=2771355 RepID=A0A927B3H0_9BACT|nr:5-formyltetrahydrofolate cyclo-ligase [Spirosoma validum]MBD2754710.1 5-formyltetrahydrofolate cyclo-ligase [Spirosoma validum]